MSMDVFTPNTGLLDPADTSFIDSRITHAPTRPVDVTPQARQTWRGHVSIVSIYPGNLHKRVRHNGITIYQLPAAPRGSYSLLRVYDTQEWLSRPDPANGKLSWMPMPISAQVVADDLVATWANDTLGKRSGFSPGIGIIAGDDPTDKELADLRFSQSALFDWYIKDAHGKHTRGQTTEITDVHRLAAREMLDKGAERLAWFPTTIFAAVKECIACGQQIDAKSKVCDKCGTNLIDWYKKYNLSTDDDPVIAAFVNKINGAKPFKPVISQPIERPIERP